MVATCAHGDAQRRVVSATPMRGRMGFSFFTMLGKNSLVRTPRTVGTKTTWNVLRARPCTNKSLGHTHAKPWSLKVILTLLQIFDRQADSRMNQSEPVCSVVS